MASVDTNAVAVPGSKPAARVLWLYGGTLFLSAFLLFSVQPMFTKMVLPRLGGSPAVWSVAMVVFQGLLLAGYLYAFALTRYCGRRAAVALHLVVTAVAFVALPIAVAEGWGRPPNEGAALWLVALFVASIGLPFFAVSGNGPLLQAWFARTGHVQARDPYFLYGASNIGSFAALLAYPVVVEPLFTLQEQSRSWLWAYAVLAGLIALCGFMVASAPTAAADAAQAAAPRPTARERLSWVGLALVPSGLLVAVTAHVSTDVAAAPFLWVVPLALFLLTFVLVFRERPLIDERLVRAAQPPLVAGLLLLLLFGWRVNWSLALFGHLAGFFVAAMICHAALYARRPAAAHLTEFYAFMSLGGVIGGAFAALLAPQLFVTVVEYPLLILAALLARPGMLQGLRDGWRRDSWRRQRGALALLGVLVALPALAFGYRLPLSAAGGFVVAVMALALLVAFQGARPLRFLALTAIGLLAIHLYEPGAGQTIFARSFFGVHKVVDAGDGRFRVLYHGTTVHGAERVRSDDGAALAQRPDPLTYYYSGGPYAEAIDAVRARAGGTLKRVAVVGLGVGALSCQSAPGEAWSFYEIDPEVVRLATDRSLFRSIALCAKDAPIVVGDARLTLADAEPGFDMILLDAFTSDVVPVHLLTREAVALYAAKLAPHGAVAFNISNRHIELASVVAASAAANGLVARVKRDGNDVDTPRTLRARAEIVVVARPDTELEKLGEAEGWRLLAPRHDVRTWTDDFSDIVGAIRRKLAE